MTEFYEYLGGVDEEQVDDVDSAQAVLDEVGLCLVYRPSSGHYEILRWTEGEIQE